MGMQERPTLDTCHFKLNWNPFNKIYGQVWQMTGWWDFHYQLSNFKIWISSSIFHPQTAFDARARYTISPCLFVPSGKPYLALSRIPLMLKAIEREDELFIIHSLLFPVFYSDIVIKHKHCNCLYLHLGISFMEFLSCSGQNKFLSYLPSLYANFSHILSKAISLCHKMWLVGDVGCGGPMAD